MPDCSRPNQVYSGNSRGNLQRCLNCDLMDARVHNVKKSLREAKRSLTRKIRELRYKCERMNLILLTVIDICDKGSPKLNRRAIEQKIKNPVFMHQNVSLANIIVSLIDRYIQDVDGDTDIQNDGE